MRWLQMLSLLLVLGLPSAAAAGMPMPVKMKCQVGGQRFTFMTTASYTIFGERPDGKPYGSWTFPLDLPVCPSNGLVMFREFSRDELVRLPPLLASEEYKRLRDAETVYYRAAWVAGRLEPNSDERAWLLLSASWEADRDPARKARYQGEFIQAAHAVERKPSDLGWFALQIRAANALRELGRFDDARRALSSVPLDSLNGVRGAKVDAETEQSRFVWRNTRSKLESLIERRDRDSEPLDYIPVHVAASYCVGDLEFGPKREDPLCDTSELAEAIRMLRESLPQQ